MQEKFRSMSKNSLVFKGIVKLPIFSNLKTPFCYFVVIILNYNVISFHFAVVLLNYNVIFLKI